MRSMQTAPLATSAGPWGSPPAQHIRQRVIYHPDMQQCSHAASTEKLQQ